MQIQNQALLADATTIINQGTYYLNEATGEIRQGVAFTSLISRLRDYEYRWRNISNIRESDFEDSGFDVLHQGCYYNTPKSPWIELYPAYGTGDFEKGRRVAKSAWIVISKNTIDREALQKKWHDDAAERAARSALYAEHRAIGAAEAEAMGLTGLEAINYAGNYAHNAMKGL